MFFFINVFILVFGEVNQYKFICILQRNMFNIVLFGVKKIILGPKLQRVILDGPKNSILKNYFL